ncbi:MAG: PQQ-dependent sugar dehydrogenase, partial [Gammaproteobacteria bacterium]
MKYSFEPDSFSSHSSTIFIFLLLASLMLGSCGGGGDGGGGNNNGDGGGDPTSGLDIRPANFNTCVAPELPGEITTVGLDDVFPDAPAFSKVTKILQAPGDASRWWILEKAGRIRVLDINDEVNVSNWLDWSNRAVDPISDCTECGLLGMAFDPDFPATPHVYVSYTYDSSGDMFSRISRLVLDVPYAPGAGTVEQMLLELDQPQGNHNGGDIAFGPVEDGTQYLYIGFGDGGGGGDPGNRAQDIRNLFGAMLRIDVLGVPANTAYRIPSSNPFSGNAKCASGDVNAASCPEIYAWGLRNPWRWSFDLPTGQLWLGDVGQDLWEEVDIIQNGGNYGWDCREGAHDYVGHNNPDACANPVGLIDPVSEYAHSGSRSITGGFVYRGTAIPSLAGRYVFADYQTGQIWALANDGDGGYTNEEIHDAPFAISSFGMGADGELYLARYSDSNGAIYRLRAGTAGIDTIPGELRPGEGCLDEDALIAYAINAPFWSDNAVKTRFMGLADGTFVTINGEDDWDFPERTVLVKSFELDGQLIETRLFMHHPGGTWAGYTYEWNEAETLATRVQGGKTRQVDAQTWEYPSEGACLRCHTNVAGRSLGPETSQLNRDYTYAATDRTANQVHTLE